MKLNCYQNKMEIGLEFDHLSRHSLPYIVKFHGDNNCPTLNASSASSIYDGRLWMNANYSECGIKAFESGNKLVFKQIVEVVYGKQMKSLDVYRHFIDTYNASCSIDRNVTHKLNIDVKEQETLDDETEENADFKFKFSAFKDDKTAISGLVFLGDLIHFELELLSNSKVVKTSPQDCFATRLDGTGRYDLIKDRCVGDDETLAITSSNQQTHMFSWEMEAFRYFGNSDGIVITCRVLVCRNNPFDQLTDECKRCGQTTVRRKRRNDEDEEEKDVLSETSLKSDPIFLVERPGIGLAKVSGDEAGLDHTEKMAIIVVCGVVALVLCVAIVKKVFFKSGMPEKPVVG
eukprot:TCONS_00059241-protein